MLVDEVTFTMNSLVNTSTGVSPHKAMYGTCLRSRVDLWLPLIEPGFKCKRALEFSILERGIASGD